MLDATKTGSGGSSRLKKGVLFAVFQKCNGRGPGRGTDMFPARTGDRKGSLLVGVTTGHRRSLRITGGHR